MVRHRAYARRAVQGKIFRLPGWSAPARKLALLTNHGRSPVSHLSGWRNHWVAFLVRITRRVDSFELTMPGFLSEERRDRNLRRRSEAKGVGLSHARRDGFDLLKADLRFAARYH